MPPLQKNHLNILLQFVIIKKWLIFHFPSLCQTLSPFLSHEIVKYVCDENNSAEACANKLHLHVLQSNNDDLYNAISNYCKEKCISLADLIKTMCVDDDDDNEISGDTQINSSRSSKQLTSKQFDLLYNKEMLLPKLQSALDKRMIKLFFNNFCKNECEISVVSLNRFLLRKNSKELYHRMSQFLQNELKNYKDCYDFMNKNIDIDQLSLVTSVDLESLNSQMCEARIAIGSLHRVFTDEIRELKEKTINKLVGEKMDVNVSYSQDQQYSSLKAEVESLKKMCHVQLEENRQLRDDLSKQQRQINDLNKKHIEVLKEMKITCDKFEGQEKEVRTLQDKVALEKVKLNGFQNQAHQIEEKMVELEKKRRNYEEPAKSANDLLPPFPLEPTFEMKETKANYKSLLSGLSPWFANKWGFYPTVNWHTLGGSVNWKNRWMEIVHEDTTNLYLPPLILPVELGSWCVQLWIEWDDGLRMCGGIVLNDQIEQSTIAQKHCNIHFIMNLSFGENLPIVTDKMFTLSENWKVLWTISANVEKNWKVPLLTIQVKQ